jgi:hypothetical protein
MQEATEHRGPGKADPRPTYHRPELRVMDESEILKAFQITSAGVTWWVS